jgi:hypothetical protein
MQSDSRATITSRMYAPPGCLGGKFRTPLSYPCGRAVYESGDAPQMLEAVSAGLGN